MVIVHLKGEMGNQMCQYALGRFIAEAKGYSLRLDSSGDGTPNILKDHFPNAVEINGVERTYNHLYLGPNLFSLDMNMVLAHDGLIYLHGYWQKHYYFLPHLHKISQWFAYDETGYQLPGQRDIVVHYRNRRAQNDDGMSLPPVDNFIALVQSMDYDRCFVLCSNPNDTNYDLNKFRQLRNVDIRSGSKMQDFTMMKHASALVMSCSTFSVWAAYLGDQRQVFAPVSHVSNSPTVWKLSPEAGDPDLIPIHPKYAKMVV